NRAMHRQGLQGAHRSDRPACGRSGRGLPDTSTAGIRESPVAADVVLESARTASHAPGMLEAAQGIRGAREPDPADPSTPVAAFVRDPPARPRRRHPRRPRAARPRKRLNDTGLHVNEPGKTEKSLRFRTPTREAFSRREAVGGAMETIELNRFRGLLDVLRTDLRNQLGELGANPD